MRIYSALCSYEVRFAVSYKFFLNDFLILFPLPPFFPFSCSRRLFRFFLRPFSWSPCVPPFPFAFLYRDFK
ncbi:hypothetical protein CW304_16400 [Bacillus sp. UFRGS-B20]|nr:hypothetical protein CW304_16400 [Bacillus sp. UFRGS-B20]